MQERKINMISIIVPIYNIEAYLEECIKSIIKQTYKELETEQQRLLELLETAESLDDILTIESRLTEVQYELDSKESQLRTYDNQIDYSTVYLDLISCCLWLLGCNGYFLSYQAIHQC